MDQQSGSAGSAGHAQGWIGPDGRLYLNEAKPRIYFACDAHYMDINNNNDNKTMTNDNTDSTTNNNDKIPLIPSSLLMCESINNHESRRLFKVLFDSGGSHTFIHSRCLPLGANPTILQTGP